METEQTPYQRGPVLLLQINELSPVSPDLAPDLKGQAHVTTLDAAYLACKLLLSQAHTHNQAHCMHQDANTHHIFIAAKRPAVYWHAA